MGTAINTPVVLETLAPAQVFTPGGIDQIVARIRAEVMAENNARLIQTERRVEVEMCVS